MKNRGERVKAIKGEPSIVLEHFDEYCPTEVKVGVPLSSEKVFLKENKRE